MPQTFAGRIFITFAAILASAMTACGLYLEMRVARFHREQALQRLETAAALLQDHAHALLRAADDGDGDGATAHIRSAVIGRDLRVTVIRADGEVILDTDAAQPIENHGGRPEVVAALTGGSGSGERRSATTGIATFYFALRIDGADAPLGVVRAATSLAAMARDLASVRRVFLTTGLLALALGLLGSAVVARYLSQPLVVIKESAALVAQGELHSPVRVSGPVEAKQLAESINSMSSDLKARLQTLTHQRGEIEAVLGSMTEGVVAVGPDERVLMMNDAAAALMGLPETLRAGDELWKHCRFPELEQALREVLKGRPAWHGDANSPTGTGGTLTIAASQVQPTHGAVAILSDVTSIRRLEQVRIDFVANVSHEMRTPLAAVLGAIETLGETDTPEDRARFIDIARRNAQRMHNIVSDLLELSHIEALGDGIALAETSIELPVRASAGALAGEAEAKGVELVVGRPSESPVLILGNDKRLEQIFTNLISNAIKYTPRGGRISVSFGVTRNDVMIAVADTGIGIPRDALPRVFERFYRVDKGRSREMGGTGLGLAIVKHATRAHGGRIEVESQEGRGTTFRVILPRLRSGSRKSA